MATGGSSEVFAPAPPVPSADILLEGATRSAEYFGRSSRGSTNCAALDARSLSGEVISPASFFKAIAAHSLTRRLWSSPFRHRPP